MTTTQKTIDKRDTIWLVILTVLPMALLWPTSEHFAQTGLSRTLISGLFGGVGALIGFGLYRLVRRKNTLIKALTAIGILISGVIFNFAANNINNSGLTTCEVCGYIAVDEEIMKCNYCISMTWDNEKSHRNYDTKEEWLRDEQLFWFALDSLTEKANFYEPNDDEGYKKDKNWKPSIAQKDLEEDLLSE